MNPFLLFPFAYLLDHRNLHKFNAEESNHLLNTCGVKKGAELDWKEKAEVSVPWIVRIINLEGIAPLECSGILISDRHLLTLSRCIRRRGDNVTIERTYKSTEGVKKEKYSVIHHVAFRAKALEENTDTIVLLEIRRVRKNGENVDDTSNFLYSACLGFDQIEPFEKDVINFLWLNHKTIGHCAAEVKGIYKPVMCGSEHCDTTYEMKSLPSTIPGSPLIKRALMQDDGFSSFKPFVIGLTLNATHALSIIPYTPFICFHIGLCREGGLEDYSFDGEVIVARNSTEPATFPMSTE